MIAADPTRNGRGTGPAGGFTLMELLVVMSVAAILAAISVPSLLNTIQMNRLDSISNQFVAALSMARSEAVKLGTTINVSSTSLATNWGIGWTVCCAPGSAAPVQTGAPLPGAMSGFGSVASIGFDATGHLVNNGAAANFIFCVDGADPTKSKGVTVALSGRVRVADTDPATGLPLENDQLTTMSACNAP